MKSHPFGGGTAQRQAGRPLNCSEDITGLITDFVRVIAASAASLSCVRVRRGAQVEWNFKWKTRNELRHRRHFRTETENLITVMPPVSYPDDDGGEETHSTQTV